MRKRIDHAVNFFSCLAAMYSGWLVSLTGWPLGAKLGLVFAAWLSFLLINVFPRWRQRPTLRLTVLAGGVELLLQFLVVTLCHLAVAAGVGIAALLGGWDPRCLWGLLGAAVGGFVLFTNGILRLYLTSKQLGVKWRVIGLVCGWIPLLNLWALVRILRICYCEVVVESDRMEIDLARVDDGVCATRYPVILVHGVFFRDHPARCYWGRIPKTLQKNGATIYFGEQQSATSVEESGRELADRIRQVMEETGCDKVNLIGHSKGGLDSRYAISCLGMAPYVASLTTVNTPHRGCRYVTHLLDTASDGFRQGVEKAYNRAFRQLGDEYPDFIGAVTDLTAEHCAALNEQMPDMPGVYYQSVGSFIPTATAGRFPANAFFQLAKQFDEGENDGMVAVPSMEWGERFLLLEPTGNRGISHGDVIDLYHENIPGFDVREFYVTLLQDLKSRGF